MLAQICSVVTMKQSLVKRCSSISIFLLGLFTYWAMALQFSGGCHCVEDKLGNCIPITSSSFECIALDACENFLTSEYPNPVFCNRDICLLAWYLQCTNQEGRILRNKDFGEQCQSSCSFLTTATSVIAGTAGNNIMLAWIEIDHMLWCNSDRVFEVHKQVQSFAFVHSSAAGCRRDHWRKSLNTVLFHISFSGFPGSLILSLCSK